MTGSRRTSNWKNENLALKCLISRIYIAEDTQWGEIILPRKWPNLFLLTLYILDLGKPFNSKSKLTGFWWWLHKCEILISNNMPCDRRYCNSEILLQMQHHNRQLILKSHGSKRGHCLWFLSTKINATSWGFCQVLFGLFLCGSWSIKVVI